MSEIYTFCKVEDGPSGKLNKFNQEFNDKLHNGYSPHKITLYLDKQIDNLDDTLLKNIYTLITIVDIFFFVYNDSIEFINNKLSYTISSMNTTFFKNYEQIYVNINNNIYDIYNLGEIKYNILSVDIELKKHDFIILNFNAQGGLSRNEYNKYIIKSNYFKTFDELIKFIMYDSGLSYELSKKHLTEKSGISNYFITRATENDPILIEGFNDEKPIIYENDYIEYNDDDEDDDYHHYYNDYFQHDYIENNGDSNDDD